MYKIGVHTGHSWIEIRCSGHALGRGPICGRLTSFMLGLQFCIRATIYGTNGQIFVVELHVLIWTISTESNDNVHSHKVLFHKIDLNLKLTYCALLDSQMEFLSQHIYSKSQFEPISLAY